MRKPRTKTELMLNDIKKSMSFVKKAVGDTVANRNFVRLADGRITATDGILIKSCPIFVDIDASVDFTKLQTAIDTCTNRLRFSLGKGSLTVQSARRRTFVPTLADENHLSDIEPDPVVVEVKEDIKLALEIASKVPKESDQNIAMSTVLMVNGGFVSCNGPSMVYAYHGQATPEGIAIPQKAVLEVVANPNKLVAIGKEETSITFYFSDESYIKTNIYTEGWPENPQKNLDLDIKTVPVKEDFKKAVKDISKHLENHVYLENGFVGSHKKGSYAGIEFEVDSVYAKGKFDKNALAGVIQYMKEYDPSIETPNGQNMLVFNGEVDNGLGKVFARAGLLVCQ